MAEPKKTGLQTLLNQQVALWCVNYIYTGKLIEVNSECVRLAKAAIVYETGGLCDKKWLDAQPLPFDWYVNISAIESFGKADKNV